MKETVLLFNLSDKSVRLKLEMVLFQNQVRLRTIAKENYAKPLGFLAGSGEVADNGLTYDGDELPEPMLVFAGLSDEKLNRILAGMRAAKVGPVSHKAVLTPTNQFWDVLQCYAELDAEHRAMTGK